MGRYDINIRCEQIHDLIDQNQYLDAMEEIEELDFQKIPSIYDIYEFAELFLKAEKLDRAKELYYTVYERTGSKPSLYRLILLLISMGDTEEARELFYEYEKKSKYSLDTYELKYRLLCAEGASRSELIQILQELKANEHTEEWGYQLARLYEMEGLRDLCIKECEDVKIWFGSGKIVDKAMELRERCLSSDWKKPEEEKIPDVEMYEEEESDIRVAQAPVTITEISSPSTVSEARVSEGIQPEKEVLVDESAEEKQEAMAEDPKDEQEAVTEAQEAAAEAPEADQEDPEPLEEDKEAAGEAQEDTEAEETSGQDQSSEEADQEAEELDADDAEHDPTTSESVEETEEPVEAEEEEAQEELVDEEESKVEVEDEVEEESETEAEAEEELEKEAKVEEELENEAEAEEEPETEAEVEEELENEMEVEEESETEEGPEPEPITEGVASVGVAELKAGSEKDEIPDSSDEPRENTEPDKPKKKGFWKRVVDFFWISEEEWGEGEGDEPQEDVLDLVETPELTVIGGEEEGEEPFSEEEDFESDPEDETETLAEFEEEAAEEEKVREEEQLEEEGVETPQTDVEETKAAEKTEEPESNLAEEVVEEQPAFSRKKNSKKNKRKKNRKKEKISQESEVAPKPKSEPEPDPVEEATNKEPEIPSLDKDLESMEVNENSMVTESDLRAQKTREHLGAQIGNIMDQERNLLRKEHPDMYNTMDVTLDQQLEMMNARKQPVESLDKTLSLENMQQEVRKQTLEQTDALLKPNVYEELSPNGIGYCTLKGTIYRMREEGQTIHFALAGGEEGISLAVAKRLFKELRKMDYFEATGIGKIAAEDFEEVDIEEWIEKFLGGCIYVMNAPKLSEISVSRLSKLMDQYGNQVVIVLEGQYEEMDEFLSDHSELEKKFAYKVRL